VTHCRPQWLQPHYVAFRGDASRSRSRPYMVGQYARTPSFANVNARASKFNTQKAAQVTIGSFGCAFSHARSNPRRAASIFENAGLRFGSPLQHARIRAAYAGPGIKYSGGTGGRYPRWSTAYATATGVIPAYGVVPIASSQRITPNENASACSAYRPPAITSGGIQWNEPTCCV